MKTNPFGAVRRPRLFPSLMPFKPFTKPVTTPENPLPLRSEGAGGEAAPHCKALTAKGTACQGKPIRVGFCGAHAPK
jgi:hypothetical protein